MVQELTSVIQAAVKSLSATVLALAGLGSKLAGPAFDNTPLLPPGKDDDAPSESAEQRSQAPDAER